MRLWLVALYALAMATAGFAHRPMPEPPRDGADIGAIIAADGSFAPYCVSDGGNPDRPHPALASGSPCEACLLTAAPGLTACSTASSVAPPQTAPQIIAATAVRRVFGRDSHVAHLRGPPALSFDV